MHASLVQQLTQLFEVRAGVGEVGQSVQGRLITLVSQGAQGLSAEVRIHHDNMLQPCPKGKVKCDHGQVITIGQLAKYVGVSTKTIRVYHDKGLLPEPERDASGYRRYGAGQAIDLIKIRTLAEAGVPLARIRDLRSATDEEFRRALHQIDIDLSTRIRGLAATQERLRQLADGHLLAIPDEVRNHLEQLPHLGFSERWVALQNDLWILVFATHPDTAITVFHDQAQILADPTLRKIFLEYDHAHDLEPHDRRIDDLARRIVEATHERYGTGDLPGYDTSSEIPALIQGAVNASSPAWRRLDTLIREQLGA
jgi:DNA-binding transcriptional MerR regulator